MKLHVPFVQLPLLFDAERLAAEVGALGEDPWRAHPKAYPGNSAMTLISTGGDPDSDALGSQMLPTPWLQSCPYLMQALAAVGGTLGRTRLMRLAGQAEVSPHVDVNYYWREHMRVHVPIVTQSSVRFYCGNASVHMAAGECWIFDTWQLHRVVNDAQLPRIHLVIDTVGGDGFWELVSRARTPERSPPNWKAELVEPAPRADSLSLDIESVNVPKVMSPWELREHLTFLVDELRPDPLNRHFESLALHFSRRWHALWAAFGDSDRGRERYRVVLNDFFRELPKFEKLLLRNGSYLTRCLYSMILGSALGDHMASGGEEVRSMPGTAPGSTNDITGSSQIRLQGNSAVDPIFERPVFIVSPPRSGSTLLFETMAQAPGVVTVGGESHQIIEGIPELSPATRGWESNQLFAEDATDEICAALRERFRSSLRDRDGKPPAAGRVRLLEKTPKNSLRLPFLDRVFPEGRFVYLYREPQEVLASMIEAWQSGKFRMYSSMPGWTGLPWSLVLMPGWRSLVGRSLPEIVAVQWAVTTGVLLDALESLPRERWCAVRYSQLLTDPQSESERLCRWAGWDWDRSLGAVLPLSKYTVSKPDPDKWRKHAGAIDSVRRLVSAQHKRAEALLRTVESK